MATETPHTLPWWVNFTWLDIFYSSFLTKYMSMINKISNGTLFLDYTYHKVSLKTVRNIYIFIYIYIYIYLYIYIYIYMVIPQYLVRELGKIHFSERIICELSLVSIQQHFWVKNCKMGVTEGTKLKFSYFQHYGDFDYKSSLDMICGFILNRLD